MRCPRPSAWLVYLSVGAVAAVVYFTLTAGRVQNVMYDLTALSSLLAILYGVRRWKPEWPKPWYFLAAYQGLTLLGELIYDDYDLVRHVDAPVPSLADAGFLLAYPFLIAGVVMLARQRSGRRDRGTLLDATIVATGIGLLWWIAIVVPTIHGDNGSIAEQLTSTAYPLMDIAMMFVLVRLALEHAARTTAFRLLTFSVLATLAADLAYAVTTVTGVYSDGALMDLGWLAGFLLMGAAALHPSMRAVSSEKSEYRPRFGLGRLIALSAAALMAPAALAVVAARHDYEALPAIIVASAATFLLVIARMAGLIRDIQSKVTELDARGEELLQAETRYRTVVEHIPAVTFLQHVDPTDAAAWETVYISPQVEPMFGFTPDEWIRERPWEGLVEPEDLEAILVADRRRLATGEPLREEYRMRSRDGGRSWVHSEVVLVGTTPAGSEIWQGVMFDVTGHKLAEEALRKALAREREAAKRLRSLDEMKNTFLHAVSHDLRTPLAAIMGSALTLDRDDLVLSAEDQRDLIGRMATNSRKLDRLLSDLLDLDRLDRGIVEPDRQPTDIGALVRRTVAESELLAGRSVNVDTATPGLIDIDPAQVERILENLVTNSVRHTPASTPMWIKVRLEGTGVLIAVEDAGPGVPKELRTTIFEAFAQGPSPNQNGPGVGIGLSLVARFAELHGGRAWVEERAGGGSSFRVFLPGRVHGPEDGSGATGVPFIRAAVASGGGSRGPAGSASAAGAAR